MFIYVMGCLKKIYIIQYIIIRLFKVSKYQYQYWPQKSLKPLESIVIVVDPS